MAALAAAAGADTTLQVWVREHQVCWEVGPYFEHHHH
jgi:hypothetical protein